MEIGSMDSMIGMMGMQSGSERASRPDASEMSSKFMDELDSDGDGSLSKSEFAVDGESGGSESVETFDALDTNEDGFVSQEELEADMEAKMGAMMAKHQFGGVGGIQQTGDADSFNQLMEMMGGNSDDDKRKGADAYAQMNDGVFGSGPASNQTLSAGLDIRA